ncbi:Hsp20/alpha crystallin family protein [Neobacillus sp. YIM B06451]|uniref:Hsp20/alpha crystallin family protein n=1 Tax=Neobacillus sp. YIM B06451 TaxID=3070994 RepID=UPI00292D4264|nr:Hsp20/alpha crystallin family protein [Neobacillus sp. YIM B06451]
MKNKGRRSQITKILGSDFVELLTEVAPLIGPRIDCMHTEDSLYITVDLAGAKPKDVKLGISSGGLLISGEIHPLIETPASNFIKQERFYGPFQRKIKLPVHCVPSQIKAELAYGILSITIPLLKNTNNDRFPGGET